MSRLLGIAGMNDYMRRFVVLPCAIVLLISTATAQRTTQKKTLKQTPATLAIDDLTRTREAFVKATKDYKESLQALIATLEKNIKRSSDEVERDRQLYQQGLIARRQLEDSEKRLQIEQDVIAARRKELSAADKNIADVFAEAEADQQLNAQIARTNARAKSTPKNTIIATATLTRYTGSGSFSLASGAGRVGQFFASRFNRSLPVSAFGQTAVHDRLGFDHHNALDVAVNPDSTEGQALTAYLRANGIPFIAIRRAIPGSATGAHIHIGLPSHRTHAPIF